MFKRIWNIAKNIFMILGLLFCILSFVYIFFHDLPKSTTSVNKTLDCVKLDEYGECAETFPVTIQGVYHENFRRLDDLQIEISGFDDFLELRPAIMNNVKGGIFEMMPGQYSLISYHAKRNETPYRIMIYFSPDFSRWLFEIRIDDLITGTPGPTEYYVASSTPGDTLDALLKYFHRQGTFQDKPE